MLTGEMLRGGSKMAGISKFRLRRWLFGKQRRNPIVGFFAKQSLKNVTHYDNEDRNPARNGEFWLQHSISEYYLSKKTVPVVFDVGANIGDWAANMVRMKPDINLHCFEPSGATFSLLKQRMGRHECVNLNRAGLSHTRQEVDFYENDSADVTSVFHRFDAQNDRKVRVSLISGDDYIKSKKVLIVDFLKLDIEGMEYDALIGLKEALSDGKIQVIQFEYGEFNIQSEKLLKHFYEYLTDYEIGRLHPDHIEFSGWNHTKENFRAANYIAVLKSNTSLLAYLKG
jgi:FkbM family methyltransferase